MLLSKYHVMEFNTNQDPAVFIANMQSMCAKIKEADLSQVIGDQAFILHINNKLLEQYDSVHHILEKDIDAGVWPTISEVLEKLTIGYHCIQACLNENGGRRRIQFYLQAGSKETVATVASVGIKSKIANHQVVELMVMLTAITEAAVAAMVPTPIMMDVEMVVASMARLKPPTST
jgi:hypothetical protein